MQQLVESKLKPSLSRLLSLSPGNPAATMSIPTIASTTTSRCTTRPSWFCYFLSQSAIIFLLLSLAVTSVQLGNNSNVATMHHHNQQQPTTVATSGVGGGGGGDNQWPDQAATSTTSDSLVTSDMETIAVKDGSHSTVAANLVDGITTVATPAAIGVTYANDDEDDSAADNTTLPIDYDQQGYNLATASGTTATRKLTATRADEASATTTTTVADVVPSSPPVTTAKSLASSVDGTATSAKLLVARGGDDGDKGKNHSQTQTLGEGQAAQASGSQQQRQQAKSGYRDDYEDNRERDDGDDGVTRGGGARRLRSNQNNGAGESSKQLKGGSSEEESIYELLFKKRPYSKLWSVERKWDDVFKRLIAVGNRLKLTMAKKLMKDMEYYADVSISQACADDVRWAREYDKKSTNFKWLLHMLDSQGKLEPGMLTGNLANLGHVVQCIKVRAPAGYSNESFDEQYFVGQTAKLGERFRGKYCLASVRPVLPERPRLVSRFSELIDSSLLSNISYMGEPLAELKARARQLSVPGWLHEQIAGQPSNWLDQTPFESELYQYLIDQRNFMFNLPRFMGVCYPSSCSREDIRASLQRTMDDKHQVVDIEFECEQEEEEDGWSWFSTPRLVVYVFLALVASLTFGASLARYILVDKLRLRRRVDRKSQLGRFISLLDFMSMDKCAGLLFVKTQRASTLVDATKSENWRSTSIDALKGFLILILIYSELIYLGCLPVPFMWSKWADAMFPFYRSLPTQVFLNVAVWSEAFYLISAYLIGAKLLENYRVRPNKPVFGLYALRRYCRLVLPMVAFLALNYVWPRLSNGFVMQDQAQKLMAPCDRQGWTNMLLFHNHQPLNETCLWPSHVSATFFQLHLLSYPILLLMLATLQRGGLQQRGGKLAHMLLRQASVCVPLLLALFGLLYPAYKAAYEQELIVPFLIDYIDYDNYARVLEWTQLPTYNHLASYMLGLLLAYAVVKRRQEAERRAALSSSASVQYLHQLAADGASSSLEGSRSSTPSSSSHQHHFKRPIYSNNCVAGDGKPAAPITVVDGSKVVNSKVEQQESWAAWLRSMVASGLALTVLLASLTASWLWTGLGRPMDADQTFWFMVLTKLFFLASFAYLFHKHFATRRNSRSPWMLTRFLVPIGRMSLTAFYVGWLVIWFDLLASLYQWHPSHYFVIEKFYEIIFITLIVAMFVYGAFEGQLKMVEIVGRNRRLKRLPLAAGFSHPGSPSGFDGFFEPLQADDDDDDGDTSAETTKLNDANKNCDSFPVGKMTNIAYKPTESEQSAAGGGLASESNSGKTGGKTISGGQSATTGGGGGDNGRSHQRQTKGPGGGKLSIVDQYKLNAELRANYSFASIGLYESAGATGEFTHPAHSGDPQASPASSKASS